MSRRKTQRSATRVGPTGQIQRLLARLSAGACLARDPDGSYWLTTDGRDGRSPVPSGAIEACLANEWLALCGEELVLSDVGRFQLRRSRAGEDDRFRQQHQNRAIAELRMDGERRQAVVNQGESPLGWLRSRKDRNGRRLIDDAQFEAGERLRADYWFARMSPRVTSNWSASAPLNTRRRGALSNPALLRDDVIAAKGRVMRALAAVGPEISGVLLDVCCELKGLEEAEKENGWPQRAGKVVLQIALTRLAKHYGMIATEPSRQSRLRHWGDADFRPRIDGVQGSRGESAMQEPD